MKNKRLADKFDNNKQQQINNRQENEETRWLQSTKAQEKQIGYQKLQIPEQERVKTS